MSILLTNQRTTNKLTAEQLPAETFSNVSYGTDSLQKMDIYLPAARSKDSTKVIMLIHGGAWNGGDKADFASYISLIKNKLPDYAVININYRLATQKINHFPTQENDVKSAINFLYKKRNEYDISEKLVLLGASAGAHLALLHAYKYSDPVKIQSVISFFGPTDLISMYNSITNSYYQWAMQILVGGTPANILMLSGNQVRSTLLIIKVVLRCYCMVLKIP